MRPYYLPRKAESRLLRAMGFIFAAALTLLLFIALIPKAHAHDCEALRPYVVAIVEWRDQHRKPAQLISYLNGQAVSYESEDLRWLYRNLANETPVIYRHPAINGLVFGQLVVQACRELDAENTKGIAL